MACGIPCVVTDVGDSALLVSNSGVVVPANSPEALAAAICDLLAAEPTRRRVMGEVARRRIEAEFALGSIVRRYEDVYREHIVPDRRIRVSSYPI
jgi:glycosyltransferase involved in cell wall biosynthesis